MATNTNETLPTLVDIKTKYTDPSVMPAIFQRSQRLKKLWYATHDLLAEEADEKSTADVDAEVNDSEDSDSFWDELAQSDDEDASSGGQPDVEVMDE